MDRVVSEVQILWEGTVDEKQVRILQCSSDDCLVEELVPLAESDSRSRYVEGNWTASNDEIASHTYMAAFLETRKQLKDVAEFAVSGPPKT